MSPYFTETCLLVIIIIIILIIDKIDKNILDKNSLRVLIPQSSNVTKTQQRWEGLIYCRIELSSSAFNKTLHVTQTPGLPFVYATQAFLNVAQAMWSQLGSFGWCHMNDIKAVKVHDHCHIRVLELSIPGTIKHTKECKTAARGISWV